MTKWYARHSTNFKEYFLAGTPWFVSHPTSSAHAAAMGLPNNHCWMVYEAGADPCGCAARRGFFRTLKEAKGFVEKPQEKDHD